MQNIDFIEFVFNNLKLDEESEKIHMPFFYFLLADNLKFFYGRPSFENFILLLEKVCFKLDNKVFVTSEKLGEYCKPKFNPLKSPTSCQFDIPPTPSMEHLASSPVFPPIPTIIEPEKSNCLELNTWVPNVSDILRMYKNIHNEEKEFLSNIRTGKLPIQSALNVILEFFGSYISFSNSAVASKIIEIQYNIIFRHHKTAGITFSIELSEKLYQCFLKAESFTTFKCCAELLLNVPNPSTYKSIKPLILKVLFANIKLWGYLAPPLSLYYADIYRLFRLISEAHSPRIVEYELLLLMNDSSKMQEHYSKLGILWRLYESQDAETSLLLRRPLFVIFDGLLKHDSAMVQASETWIRVYVRSIDR